MTLHQDAIIFDGLLVSNWSREVFEAMHEGGLTAANCTHALPYLRAADSFKSLANWKGWLQQHDDILLQVYTTEDIHRAKRENKVGIVLGWQDTTHFDDYLPFVQVFKELGVGVVQLTYNTANAVGSGCCETDDGGLTDFGRELIVEMNRVGIAIDLSHVGYHTADDAIDASEKPVTYSHISPSARFEHFRNKTDEQLRKLADNDGHMGVTMHPPFQPKGNDATLDDFIDSIEHVINVAGEDHVGIGTDFVQGYSVDGETFEYLLRDKGHARKLAEIDELGYPENFSGIQDFPELTKIMEQRGWRESRIRKVMGENWVSFLKKVWGN